MNNSRNASVGVPILVAVFAAASASGAWTPPTPVDFPTGWRLNRSGTTAATMEYKVIDDPAGAYKGKRYAYLKGHMMIDGSILDRGTIPVAAGDRFDLVFYVRTPGKSEVSARLYAYERITKGKGVSATTRYSYMGGLPILTQQAGANWSKVGGSITIPETMIGKRVNAVNVSLSSAAGAYFDFVEVVHNRAAQWMNYEDAYYEGGRKLIDNDYAGALEDFSSALSLATTDVEKAEASKKMKEVAQRNIMANVAPIVDDIFSRADIYLKEGRYSAARSEYDKLKDLRGLDYNTVLALSNIAETYRLEKDYANAHRTFNDMRNIKNLTPHYKIYGSFREAEVCLEEKDYSRARELYQSVLATSGGLEAHRFRARLLSADTYRMARQYRAARGLYERLLREEEASDSPHESQRLDLIERLEAIESLTEGQEDKSSADRRTEWVNRPKHGIYVSLQGGDSNPGTKEKPLASITRAQQEVRRIKAEEGLPQGGIAVYLRGGKYFVTESISFGREDSGTADAPVVYRSYPGEDARIVGGRQVTNFKPLNDPDILRRVPGEVRSNKLWVADLREAGIEHYGELLNRGHSYPFMQPGAMELFFNTRPMRLARWPKEGWEIVADLASPDGDSKVGQLCVQKGRFKYSGDRPNRWTEEKDIMTAGYFLREWDKVHTRVTSIDRDKRIMTLAPDIRHHKSVSQYYMPVAKGTPYYLYNILSELSAPGEFYIDRDTGKLYFYPPAELKDSEIVVSTLADPLVELRGVSNMVLFGLTLEATWRNAIEISGGSNNLVAGSTIRNTGIMGVLIEDGWRHGVVGCDIHDTGEGGIRFRGGDVERLVPGGHYAENNHICRFNRFSHGGSKFGIVMLGVGHRAAHNLIHDGSYIAVMFNGNDHVIEYNEVYDAMHEGQDGGALYNHNGQAYLRGRGNVMRWNFIHHIAKHCSPTRSSLVAGITIDGFNGGMTMVGNVLYRNPSVAIFTHGPDTRIENNFFIDNNVSIAMARRLLLDHTRVETLLRTVERLFREVNYKQPPWSSRYPQMVTEFEDRLPLGKTEDNAIERNVNVGGTFIHIPLTIDPRKSVIGSNWTQGAPLFVNAERMDFRLRPGAPAFGTKGVEPIPVEKIGLYEDALRASWPVSRDPGGKYYLAEKVVERTGEQQDTDPMTRRFPPLKKVSETREYEVRRKHSPITIDGRLDRAEWLELDRGKAMVIEEHHATGRTREGAESRAWLCFDDAYLYIGIENCADPWREGLERRVPSSLNELTIEGLFSKETPWWEEGLPIGPLYTFSGSSDGQMKVHNLTRMPQETVDHLEKTIEYESAVIAPETYHWTAEWKIPWSSLAMSIADISTLRFNLGGPKRGGWFAWVATGGSLWRLDNAGILKVIRDER